MAIARWTDQPIEDGDEMFNLVEPVLRATSNTQILLTAW